MIGPSLETGEVLDAALSGELLQKVRLVSVMAVHEQCEEKDLGAG
jgi:hypothetical protein